MSCRGVSVLGDFEIVMDPEGRHPIRSESTTFVSTLTQEKSNVLEKTKLDKKINSLKAKLRRA